MMIYCETIRLSIVGGMNIFCPWPRVFRSRPTAAASGTRASTLWTEPGELDGTWDEHGMRLPGLVNIQKMFEHIHRNSWWLPINSMVIFNSYVKLPEGILELVDLVNSRWMASHPLKMLQDFKPLQILQFCEKCQATALRSYCCPHMVLAGHR